LAYGATDNGPDRMTPIGATTTVEDATMTEDQSADDLSDLWITLDTEERPELHLRLPPSVVEAIMALQDDFMSVTMRVQLEAEHPAVQVEGEIHRGATLLIPPVTIEADVVSYGMWPNRDDPET
jgi:hypothetical protein